MKRAALLILPLFCLFVGCNDITNSKDIETVKKSDIPSLPIKLFLDASPTQSTIESGINKITGVTGTVKWESFHTDKYKDNPDIVCVQATINKTSDKGKKQTVLFQFLLNRKTNYVELGHFDVDSKQKTKLETMMALQYGII